MLFDVARVLLSREAYCGLFEKENFPLQSDSRCSIRRMYAISSGQQRRGSIVIQLRLQTCRLRGTTRQEAAAPGLVISNVIVINCYWHRRAHRGSSSTKRDGTEQPGDALSVLVSMKTKRLSGQLGAGVVCVALRGGNRVATADWDLVGTIRKKFRQVCCKVSASTMRMKFSRSICI